MKSEKAGGFYTFTISEFKIIQNLINKLEDKIVQQQNKHEFEVIEIKKRLATLEDKNREMENSRQTLIKRISRSLPKL